METKTEKIQGWFQNFWFYHKWKVLIALGLILVLAVLIAQCSSSHPADYSVVVNVNGTLNAQQLESFQQELVQYAEDVNADGIVDVEIINISYWDRDKNTQLAQANITKLIAQISMSECFIYIGDQRGMEQFAEYELPAQHDFLPDYDHTAWNWKGSAMAQNLKNTQFPEDLYFTIRKVAGTAIEDDKDVFVREQQSLDFLQRIVEQSATEK